jgi:hypothetical protein
MFVTKELGVVARELGITIKFETMQHVKNPVLKVPFVLNFLVSHL